MARLRFDLTPVTKKASSATRLPTCSSQIFVPYEWLLSAHESTCLRLNLTSGAVLPGIFIAIVVFTEVGIKLVANKNYPGFGNDIFILATHGLHMLKQLRSRPWHIFKIWGDLVRCTRGQKVVQPLLRSGGATDKVASAVGSLATTLPHIAYTSSRTYRCSEAVHRKDRLEEQENCP